MNIPLKSTQDIEAMSTIELSHYIMLLHEASRNIGLLRSEKLKIKARYTEAANRFNAVAGKKLINTTLNFD
jgi:hypothetical protein